MPTKINLDEEYLKLNFEKYSKEELADYFGVDKQIIYKRTKELGLIRKQKYTYHVDYFKTWSHDMAYILGFITADGYITTDNKGSYRISIEINTKDIALLYYIAKQLGKNILVKSRIRFDKRTNKSYYISSIRINCKEIFNDLIKLGISTNKTGKEILPEIPDEFKFSYLCGYHDGDGYLRKCKNRGYLFQFTCMNEQFLKSIQTICGDIGTVQKHRTWFNYNITRKEPCMKLDAEMTRNVSFCLKRKHF